MAEYLGDYELTRHLATGGMAEIWIARQSGPAGFDRELVIKRILPHLSREQRFISMFLDEAHIASRLRHPNIVQIYELGEEEGEYFIAMEYIEGGDLADLLDKAEERGIDIPIAMSVRIIAEVLAALDFAHDYSESGKPLHIVHRDVSPHNVLIGSDGLIKLVDFGIAHAVERHSKTQTGMVKGKLSYMSPQQVEQEPLDRRADIFSAGCLLYELLTGEPPFGRELAAINGILNDDPPDPREIRPEIPDELVEIINRSLEKDPDDRYQTALEMLEELEAVLRAFDKYVSPKHVARFADRLLNDETLEGYDDVSQAVPRAMAQQAMAHIRAEQAEQLDAPEVKISPAVRRAIELHDPSGKFSVRPKPDESVVEHEPLQIPRWVPFAAGFGVLAIIGLVLGATSGDDEPIPAEKEAPVVIELDPQFVEDEEDAGLYFDERELHLVDLENWVDEMSPKDVEQMLAANFGHSDADYLWTVRAKELAEQFSDPPEPVNPGDPDAPKLLGLEEFEEFDVTKVEPQKRERKIRPKRRERPRNTTVARKTERRTKPKQQVFDEGKPQARAKTISTSEPNTEESAPRKEPKEKKKTDLEIIDRAVPY